MGCGTPEKPCGHGKYIKKIMLGNGDVQYVMQGIEPPPTVKGYKRDKNDPWLFHLEQWPDCSTRMLNRLLKSNGMMGAHAICMHPQHAKDEVELSECEQCQLRRNIESGQ